MSIDVGAAKIRAGQLEQYSIWLKKAKAKMLEYKSQINDNWSGKEVTHINLAIDQVIHSLKRAICDLESVSSDVVRIANTIRAEEIEAERQQNIREATDRINRLNQEIEELSRQKQEIEKLLQSGVNPQLQAEWENIGERLKSVQRDVSNWKSRLSLMRK